MRIDGLSAILPRMLSLTTQKSASAETTANAPDAGPVPSARGDIANPAIGSVQMLVAMSTLAPAAERRRKAVANAAQGLSMLDRLRQSLATGKTGDMPLNDLHQWLEQRESSDNEELEALIRQIDLRVRVEIAKLDRSI